jgi:hypothetical protein
MARTVLAVFESVFTAKLAVHELLESGLSGEMVDIVPRPKGALDLGSPAFIKSHPARMEVEQDGLGLGMRIGAGIGGAAGLTGGLLSAVGALPFVLPNLFAVSETGMYWLTIGAGLIAGILAGFILGGFLGSLAGLSIPAEELRQYARVARREPVVVTVLADWDAVDPVIEILAKHNPLELTERNFSRLPSGQAGKRRPRAEMPDSASDRR